MAPPLVGHVGGPERGESFTGEVARLHTLITEQLRAPAVVVGYSLGARLGLALAAHYPTAVAALVLVSVNPGLRGAGERTARIAEDEQLAVFLEQHGVRAFVEQRWQTQPLFASQRGLPAATLAKQTAQRLQHDSAGLAHCLRIVGLGVMPSYWDDLPQLSSRIPTTLLTGALDRKFHGLALEIRAASPKIAWHSEPNVGHNLLLEAPDVVAQRVQAALHV